MDTTSTTTRNSVVAEVLVKGRPPLRVWELRSNSTWYDRTVAAESGANVDWVVHLDLRERHLYGNPIFRYIVQRVRPSTIV
jgi:hypothetical protein